MDPDLSVCKIRDGVGLGDSFLLVGSKAMVTSAVRNGEYFKNR